MTKTIKMSLLAVTVGLAGIGAAQASAPAAKDNAASRQVADLNHREYIRHVADLNHREYIRHLADDYRREYMRHLG